MNSKKFQGKDWHCLSALNSPQHLTDILIPYHDCLHVKNPTYNHSGILMRLIPEDLIWTEFVPWGMTLRVTSVGVTCYDRGDKLILAQTGGGVCILFLFHVNLLKWLSFVWIMLIFVTSQNLTTAMKFLISILNCLFYFTWRDRTAGTFVTSYNIFKGRYKCGKTLEWAVFTINSLSWFLKINFKVFTI